MEFITKVTLYLSTLIASLVPSTIYSEGIVGQPRSFLPHQTITQQDKTISSLIYRGLFTYDIYGELVPDLVDKWEIEQEGIVYVVTLKKNQKWSDGSEITTDDLIYTSFKLPELRDVATDKVDDYTVRFTLPNKYSPFPNLLTIGIMKVNSEEANNSLSPISSGPFVVSHVQRAGPVIKEVVLKNRENSSYFKSLVFKYYTNEEELAIGAKLGEFDGFLTSNALDLETFDYYQYPLQGVYYGIFFNLRNEKVADAELRDKMEQIIDKERLIAKHGIPVEGPISRSNYTDRTLEFDVYDEALVEVLTQEEMVLTIPDLPHHEELAKELVKVWKEKLNLDVSIKKANPDTFINEVIKERNFELVLYGQEISRDPDRYANWHSTQKVDPGLNISGFEHVRADRALEEGRNEYDFEERMKHYHEFQKVVQEQTPVIFLYHPYAKYYISKYIQGFGEKYTFSIKDRFIDFNNWTRVVTN